MDDLHERTLAISVFGRELLAFRVRRTCQRMPERRKVAHAQVRRVRRLRPRGDDQPLFLVSSLLLHDCLGVLTASKKENLHAVTGIVSGRRRILERIVPLRLSHQGVGGAAAANDSLAAELIRLHAFGMLPLAYFHSHPGRGIGATAPSGTDLKTQKTMEQSGSEIIGGIFSRDGVVRFYGAGWEPRVRVLGKRIEEVQKNVYRLLPEEDVQA